MNYSKKILKRHRRGSVLVEAAFVNPFNIIGSDKVWAPIIKSSSIARSEVSNSA